MTFSRRYVLGIFISLRNITASVVDRNNGRVVASASTIEQTMKNSAACGQTRDDKAASIVGDVLAMRLKVEGLEQGQGGGIHINVIKQLKKKGLKNKTKIWAIIDSLKNNGVKLVLSGNDENQVPNDDDENQSGPSY